MRLNQSLCREWKRKADDLRSKFEKYVDNVKNINGIFLFLLLSLIWVRKCNFPIRSLRKSMAKNTQS